MPVLDFVALRGDVVRTLRWVAAGALLVAATVGLLFIFRGTAVQRVRGVGADGTPVAPAEPAFPLAVALLTGTSLASGNRVELALNGDGTFSRLWTDLRSARHFITIQMYYLAPSRVADTLALILAERARAGVAVWFLYDAFGSDLPDAYFEALRSAGLRAVAFRPLRARQDMCGRRPVGVDRNHERRQPVSRAQRRIHPHGA